MNLIWIYIFLVVKNSYLIYVLLKKYNFCWECFLQYSVHLCTISLKNTKIYFKIGTKSWRKILEGLKRKVDIFMGTKNIFNPKLYYNFLSFFFLKIFHFPCFCHEDDEVYDGIKALLSSDAHRSSSPCVNFLSFIFFYDGLWW